MNKPSEQLIDEYLDKLSSELGALPPEVQQETREELRQHLQLLVRRQHEPQQIIESALRQFGDPVEIGRRLALEWEEGNWSLSGLSLMQRIDKVRLAATTEVELNQFTPQVKLLNRLQSFAAVLSSIVLVVASRTSQLHISPALAQVALYGALGLYFAVGCVACFLEWKALGSAQDGVRAKRNVVGRAGVTILMPCLFLFPDQGFLVSGALIVFSLFLHRWGRTPATPRERLYFRVAIGYALVLGLVAGATLQLSSHWFGPSNWVWLLTLPIYYAVGRWFWKRPRKIGQSE